MILHSFYLSLARGMGGEGGGIKGFQQFCRRGVEDFFGGRLEGKSVVNFWKRSSWFLETIKAIKIILKL